MKRFTVTFEVEDDAPAPAIFQDAVEAVWAKGNARVIGGAAVVRVTAPKSSVLEHPKTEGKD
ncbi:MAG: hypothetical protein V3U60_16490 [Gammaproteobacteria bacterium]